MGNKRSNKDEEIKTDQQEEYSSEGGDGRRQNDELSSEGGDDKTTTQYPKKRNLKDTFDDIRSNERAKTFKEENSHRQRESRMKNETADHMVPGLVNRNNTCRLNSSLQALAAFLDLYLEGTRQIHVCIVNN